MRLWPWRKDILDLDSPGDVYLRRWFLFKTPWLAIYVHRIYRPDYARCEHDHPWRFLTCILGGGYVEEIDGKEYRRRPGYVGWRGAGFKHRITKLLRGPALTLVIRTRNREDWGFYDGRGGAFIHWRDYVRMPRKARVLWCDENAGPMEAMVALAEEREGAS